MEGDYRCLWSLGTGWGDFIRDADSTRILIHGGHLVLERVDLGPRLTEAQSRLCRMAVRSLLRRFGQSGKFGLLPDDGVISQRNIERENLHNRVWL